jgi:hypothetical protein
MHTLPAMKFISGHHACRYRGLRGRAGEGYPPKAAARFARSGSCGQLRRAPPQPPALPASRTLKACNARKGKAQGQKAKGTEFEPRRSQNFLLKPFAWAFRACATGGREVPRSTRMVSHL